MIMQPSKAAINKFMNSLFLKKLYKIPIMILGNVITCNINSCSKSIQKIMIRELSKITPAMISRQFIENKYNKTKVISPKSSTTKYLLGKDL